MPVEPAHLSWKRDEPTTPAILDDGRAEPQRAHQALLDYIHLGPGRSFPALLQHYRQIESPPTRSHGTLRNWSIKFEWSLRAARYDTLEQNRAEDEYRAQRDAIMQRGLALDHERVENLIALFEKLNAISNDQDALWIKDFKVLRLPDGSFERVETHRFNGDLIRHMRGLLDDIASEAGGRIPRPQPEKQEVSDEYTASQLSLDVLTPDERKEFHRLYEKLESHLIQPNQPNKPY